MDHPLPWLRYVDADRVTAPDFSFNGMKVRNDQMETLGSVHGFVVDSTSMRPYYLVVDSGGWFKSRDFLVPIGRARIDDDRDAIVVDIAKARIERFPGFDRNEFEKLDEADVRRMNDAICDACNDESVVYSAADPLSPVWGRPDFLQPDWWSTTATRLDTTAANASNDYVMTEDYPASKVARTTGELQAEEELERDRLKRAERRVEVTGDTSRQRESERERELVTARESDVSPHLDGRAQPGDVLGLETGGEQTHVGETTEDENKRRIDAERAAAKRRD